MTETWKDVPGYEGFYQVSDAGRVRSMSYMCRSSSKNGVEFLRSKQGQLLSPGDLDSRGYKFVNLYKHGVVKTALVHRLVALAFHGAPGFLLAEVNHKNGQPSDNRLSNLEWCTRIENVHHSINVLMKKPGLTKSVAATFHDSTVFIFPSQIIAEHALSGKQTGGVSWALRNSRRIYGAQWERLAA